MQTVSVKLISIIVAFTSLSEARVFDISSERFASYFGGTYGTSVLAQTAFAGADGTGMTVTPTVSSNLSGEFGFVYTTRALSLKLGIEGVEGSPLSGVSGTNAAGTSMYTMNSQVLAIIPKIGIELNMKTWGTSRFFIGGDFGTATVDVQNNYTFTTAGASAFNLSDFREEGKATTTYGAGTFNFETLMSDTTTVVFTLGYRSVSASSLTYVKDVTNFLGAQTQGGAMLNSDGSARSVDLSGPFAGMQFRFYIK